MSETTDTYTVSFKAGPNYKEALIVARGDTVQELESNILALQETVLGLVAETQNLFLTATAALDNGPSASITTLPVSGRSCPHGQRVRREGNSTKGHWVGHFCPLPKGDSNQCKPEFE